jgi:hypothetical protein
MRRLYVFTGGLVLAAALLAPSASYAQQSVNVYVGGFAPNSFGNRTRVDQGPSDDVLTNDTGFLAFRIRDFNGATVGGEYLVGITNYLEAGLGVGYYQRTVPSVYAYQVNSDGSEIEQDLKLKAVPFTATVRLLPFGHTAGIEPYIGGGVAIVNWHYTETGDWVDSTDNSIFTDTYSGHGTATGPLVLGGVRVPFGPIGIGGEVRWQDVKGNLPGDQGFATTKSGQTPWIDLGGWSYLMTFQVHF